MTIQRYSDVKSAYQDLFGKAIDEYNAAQKRDDRKKTVEGYLEDIQRKQSAKNGEKPFYETIVQIGDKDHTGILEHPAEAEQARKALWEYANSWEERNPNLKLIEITLHMDEATPHLHIDYIPVAEGYKNGLKRRNSLSKALEQQGLINEGEKAKNGLINWQERERQYISSLAEKHGLEIEKRGISRERLTVQEYKAERERITKAADAIGPLEMKKNFMGRFTITESEMERMRMGFDLAAQKQAAADLEAAARENERAEWEAQKEIEQEYLAKQSQLLQAERSRLEILTFQNEQKQKELDRLIRENGAEAVNRKKEEVEKQAAENEKRKAELEAEAARQAQKEKELTAWKNRIQDSQQALDADPRMVELRVKLHELTKGKNYSPVELALVETVPPVQWKEAFQHIDYARNRAPEILNNFKDSLRVERSDQSGFFIIYPPKYETQFINSIAEKMGITPELGKPLSSIERSLWVRNSEARSTVHDTVLEKIFKGKTVSEIESKMIEAIAAKRISKMPLPKNTPPEHQKILEKAKARQEKSRNDDWDRGMSR